MESDFQLTLSIKGGMLMNTLQEMIPSEQPIPPHILVMDDEPSVSKGLEMILSEEGYEVDIALNGESALDTFNQKSIDLLIADLRLPDMDGMEVIRQVKELRPDTGVVVITGYSSVNSAQEAIKLGASDYLPKPFSDDEIKKAVGSALKVTTEALAAETNYGVDTREGKLIQKREVASVLNRTADDDEFWIELMEKGSAALEGYHLSSEAKAAIASGDLNWINRNVGELTQKQLMFIYKRLEREAW
jgi:YesN/AraC family two-component response regulator